MVPRMNRRHRLLAIPMHLKKALRDRAMNDLIGLSNKNLFLRISKRKIKRT